MCAPTGVRKSVSVNMCSQRAFTICEVEGVLRDSAPANMKCQLITLAPYINAFSIGSHSCERMEFLGDAILSVVVTQYLYDRFPTCREGFLTSMRSKIVSANMLTNLGELLQLNNHVRDRRVHLLGHERVVRVDDILEALIAAISIDQGMNAAKTWFLNVLEHHVDISSLVSHHDSHKQRLAKLSGSLTFSKITCPKGMVSVCLKDSNGVILGTATGASRREAEENASRKALAASSSSQAHIREVPRPAMAHY